MKNFNLIRILFFIGTTSGVTGCSAFTDTQAQVTPKSVNSSQAPAATIPKFEEHLHEWQDIKPGLERLVAIEGELTELIAQLNEIVKDNETEQPPLPDKKIAEQQSVQVAAAPVVAELPALENNIKTQPPVATKKMAKKAAIDKAVISKVGTPFYALQLYSLSNRQQVKATWFKLQHKHPGILGKLDAIYEKVTIKNNLFYRVKAGKYSASDKADDVCSQLKAMGTQCIPTEFKGKPLIELTGS